MTNKKNRLLTFIISLIPGAGEMYLGFYKSGASIMVLFWGGLAFCSSLFPPMFYLLPILWFYSFFHTHNLNNMADEEFYGLEDDYLFHIQPQDMKRYKKPVACILIFIGMSVIWNYLCSGFWRLTQFLGISSPLLSILSYWVRAIPQLAVSVLFIWMGWKLFQDKKASLDDPPELEDKENRE